MDALTRLVAIEDIRQMNARYFRVLDSHQWAEYQALFTDDAVMDLSEVLPAGTPAEKLHVVGAAAIVKQPAELMTGAIMIHNGYTHEIDIQSEDRATGNWAMEDTVIFPDDVPCPFPFRRSHNFGRYAEDYRKEAGAWKIARLKLSRSWRE